jgi:hypothetical protein
MHKDTGVVDRPAVFMVFYFKYGELVLVPDRRGHVR